MWTTAQTLFDLCTVHLQSHPLLPKMFVAPKAASFQERIDAQRRRLKMTELHPDNIIAEVRCELRAALAALG